MQMAFGHDGNDRITAGRWMIGSEDDGITIRRQLHCSDDDCFGRQLAGDRSNQALAGEANANAIDLVAHRESLRAQRRTRGSVDPIDARATGDVENWGGFDGVDRHMIGRRQTLDIVADRQDVACLEGRRAKTADGVGAPAAENWCHGHAASDCHIAT